MKRTHKIWTTVSHELYAKLSKMRAENGVSTITRTMLYILTVHQECEEDFGYSSRNAKTLMVTVDDGYYNEIAETAAQNGMSISKYIRNILYSYFKTNS